MAVTQTNILVGPCKLFQVDGIDIGATAGGVEVNAEEDTNEIEIDQVPGPVDIALVSRTYTVHTQLAEATLENLKIVWGLSQPPTTDQDGNKTLNIGVERVIAEHSLRFVGRAPNGREREVIFHRVKVTDRDAWVMSKEDPTMYDVTFTALPDFTKPPGQEFGTIRDLTTTY